ncbi:MAG: phage portal protein, partial [Alistipes sp.]|nr:phage portal protein [Alistipes sp.]
NKTRPARDHPAERVKAAGNSGMVLLSNAKAFDGLCLDGYTRLSECPEIVTAVNTIAKLIGSMTIHLMENTERGDIRVRSPLSELVDIRPNRYMTRSALIQWLVRTLYLDGRGNAVIFPRTDRGQLRELIPIPAAYVFLFAIVNPILHFEFPKTYSSVAHQALTSSIEGAFRPSLFFLLKPQRSL